MIPSYRLDFARNGERMHVVLRDADGVPIACGSSPTQFPFRDALHAQMSMVLGHPCECGGTYRAPEPWPVDS